MKPILKKKKSGVIPNPLANLPSVDEEDEVITPKFTDLRQVMDYTRPLSIFYSGVEYESYLDILYDLGIRNFLMSYEYLKGKGHAQLKKYPDMHLFIDSGAYTYITNPEFESYTVEQWEDQIKKYLSWAKKHKDSIFAIADLDLQYLVGNEKVYEWRKKYFEPFMLETGIPVCFIYHEEGYDQWEYMCKRYPYVGISLNVDGNVDEADLREKFRIAEKYNTLIQGMASTRTAMLTEYPFYTVDSTTWNVGLKYGEISVWNETKMSRIKKAEFENKAFPIISRYDKKFDFDLILEEDKTELIRVNAYAFVQAEKYIHERLRSRMYWFKARAKKVDLNNLPVDFFPSPQWFQGDCSDAPDYARKMNLNPEHPQVMDMLHDVTVFMNWDNPEYADMVSWYLEPEQEQIIDQLHDLYVNRIVPDKKTKIDDLRAFYADCVSGNNDKLLQLGTNFDRIIKERDNYVEDDEEELVDIPESEVKSRLKNLLPSPSDSEESGAPEIDNLDEEIYREVGIVPTFDEKGRFVKGQVAVRKPKKVYSKKFPKFACDTCYAAQKCPEYKAGYVCAYHKMFTRFDTRDMGDIIQIMQSMVEHNVTRMQRAMVMEVINGTIDPNVTSFIDQNTRLLAQLKQMYEMGSPEVLRQTRVIRADGTREETTQITNPQGGGILEKLFGSASSSSESSNDESLVTLDEEPTPEEKPKNERYKNIEED